MTKRSDRELEEKLLDVVLELSQQTRHQTWLPFIGASMLPYIKEGDMLLVKHALHSIRLGDVIVFKSSGGGFIAHRLVFIRRYGNKSLYRTKGDNVYSLDAPILQSSVLGRVTYIRRSTACCQLVKNSKSINLEKQYIRLFNFVLALSSYTIGVLYQKVKRNT